MERRLSVLGAHPGQIGRKKSLNCLSGHTLITYNYVLEKNKKNQQPWVVDDLLSVSTCNSTLLLPLTCDGPV